MKEVFFLLTYRRKIKIGNVYVKSRKCEVDSFTHTGCRRANLNVAFNRAECHPLFRSGWSVTVLPIDEESYKAALELNKC
jgi:hypothetical protein